MSCLEPTTNMQTVLLVVNPARFRICNELVPAAISALLCCPLTGLLAKGYCLAPCSDNFVDAASQFSFMTVRQVRTEDMATTYGGTDAAQSTVVAKGRRSSYTATAPGVTDNRQHLPNKQQLSLGTWTVSTTNDVDSLTRPAWATATIRCELEKLS